MDCCFIGEEQSYGKSRRIEQTLFCIFGYNRLPAAQLQLLPKGAPKGETCLVEGRTW
jgi:hypothetical protein